MALSIEGSRLLTELTWSRVSARETSSTPSIQLRSYVRSLPGTVKKRELFKERPFYSSAYPRTRRARWAPTCLVPHAARGSGA